MIPSWWYFKCLVMWVQQRKCCCHPTLETWTHHSPVALLLVGQNKVFVCLGFVDPWRRECEDPSSHQSSQRGHVTKSQPRSPGCKTPLCASSFSCYTNTLLVTVKYFVSWILSRSTKYLLTFKWFKKSWILILSWLKGALKLKMLHSCICSSDFPVDVSQ